MKVGRERTDHEEIIYITQLTWKAGRKRFLPFARIGLHLVDLARIAEGNSLHLYGGMSISSVALHLVDLGPGTDLDSRRLHVLHVVLLREGRVIREELLEKLLHGYRQ